MPLGEVVMLTWEGAENGFVTVDYGGVRGWAYADLLGEPIGTRQSGTRGVSTITNDGVAPGTGEPAPVSEVTVAEEPVPVAADCDPSYPDLCIPPAPPYLTCDDVYGLGISHITVYAPDPHGFDGNDDGVGCESP
jgi:hypothetical protein